MKIIIDIDDDMYKAVINNDAYVLGDVDWILLENAIANSIPLPRGHGRVIDYGYVVDAIDDWINAEEYNYTNATDYLRNRIRNVPTIIEADKAESEGNA